jgi:hypothetical protein
MRIRDAAETTLTTNPCFTFSGTGHRKISAVVNAVAPATFSASWYLTVRQPDGSLLGNTASTCCGFAQLVLDNREIPADGE